MEPTVKNLPRIFTYEQITLDDPDPDKSPDDVMALYSSHYPALINGHVEGPELTEENLVYKFVTQLGAKGAKKAKAKKDGPDFALMDVVGRILLGDDGTELELPPSEILEVI